jgi:hypothetical protein
MVLRRQKINQLRAAKLRKSLTESQAATAGELADKDKDELCLLYIAVRDGGREHWVNLLEPLPVSAHSLTTPYPISFLYTATLQHRLPLYTVNAAQRDTQFTLYPAYIQPLFSLNPASIHTLFIPYASSIYPLIILYPPYIHPVCTLCSASIHPLCILYTSSIHPLYITYSSFTQTPFMKTLSQIPRNLTKLHPLQTYCHPPGIQRSPTLQNPKMFFSSTRNITQTGCLEGGNCSYYGRQLLHPGVIPGRNTLATTATSAALLRRSIQHNQCCRENCTTTGCPYFHQLITITTISTQIQTDRTSKNQPPLSGTSLLAQASVEYDKQNEDA